MDSTRNDQVIWLFCQNDYFSRIHVYVFARADVLAPWDTIPSLESNENTLDNPKSKNVIFVIIDNYENKNNIPTELWKEYFDVQGFLQVRKKKNEKIEKKTNNLFFFSLELCNDKWKLRLQPTAARSYWEFVRLGANNEHQHRYDTLYNKCINGKHYFYPGIVLSNNTNLEDQWERSQKNYPTTWDYVKWFTNVRNIISHKPLLKNNQSNSKTTIDHIHETLRAIQPSSPKDKNYILTITIQFHELISVLNYLKNEVLVPSFLIENASGKKN